MCVTFQMRTTNFEKISWGTPDLPPRSAVSPKMTTPALPMTPLFYCRIFFYLKNVDVCKKKLELNMLRFDRDIRCLSLKKKFQTILFLRSVDQKSRESSGFQDFFQFFFYMVSNYPLILYVVQH